MAYLPPWSPPLAAVELPVQPALLPQTINLISALLILLVGWIVAGLAQRLVRSLLRRTRVDEMITSAVVPTDGKGEPLFRLDRTLAALTFWVILILAVVAALNRLDLTAASEPLNAFLNQIFGFLPQLGAAAVLAAAGWIVASLARTVVLRVTRQFQLDDKLFESDAADATPGLVVSETLANVLYWLVLLFFLPLVLNALNLGSQLQPLLNLVNDFMAALPRIAKAVAIGAVGWFIARTVRLLVSNLLSATGVDKVGQEFGLDPAQPGQSVSALSGTVVFVLILIPAATAALDALEMPAIAGPAVAMLERTLNALPQIFTAAVILGAGVVIGRFIGQLVTRLLSGIGFDRVVQWLGVVEAADAAAAAPAAAENGSAATSRRTPSEIIGVLALGAVVLFAAVAASNVLDLPALTEIISGLLLLFGQILSGLLVFAVGLYLANLAAQLIRSSGTHQAQLLAQIARVAILTFSGAMALQQIGVATTIVTLAFGLTLGSIAVAAAVAFGLGGREVAGEQLRAWLKGTGQS
ncbi:hypothetical protein EVJ50_06390 [Synechococcus sp. RSCCF101]|uniref:mechanosensitive ion channel n=1 Tax=Synechococcus sp. RSCCF101 TaxID=2511069 RepID=UPI001247FE6C|nr:mechanosensitive ion channel [Synechococcus sp. RSCCF101]QEY31925.1 hypothetical protein EVJ50_06390 [Synechococcus sp. RSCCF101]